MIPGRVTVGDTDQDKTVQITIDLPEPGGHILGLDVPVDLGILAQRVVIEVRIEDLLAALGRTSLDELSDAARDNLEHWSRDHLDG